jgi:predicted lipid-binding transport protein (Tim44 family)
VRKLLRLAALVGLAIWAWRRFAAPSRPQERAGASYADGSSVVLEPGSPGFERLAAIVRPAIRQ